jgi:hypothetical protein
MADLERLDLAYQLVLDSFLQRGQGLHYTELARILSVPPEAGRELLHKLMATGIPAWVYPETDLIASFAPFNSLPTQYRVMVEGRQQWFAQCGFEALAVGWVFPGKAVTVQAPCLDCGELLRVTLRDGVLLEQSHPGMVGYVDVPFGQWRRNMAYS